MSDLERFHLRPEGEKAFGYVQAVKAGGYLHLAGALAVNDDFAPVHPGDMAAQIDAVYETIARTLNHFGAGMADIVKETIFVTDMDAFIAANERRLRAYDGALPAATAVQVQRLAFPECMIEVETLAVAANR